MDGQLPPLEFGGVEGGNDSDSEVELFHDDDEDSEDEMDMGDIDQDDAFAANRDQPRVPPLRNNEPEERPFDPMDPVLQDDQVVS